MVVLFPVPTAWHVAQPLLQCSPLGRAGERRHWNSQLGACSRSRRTTRGPSASRPSRVMASMSDRYERALGEADRREIDGVFVLSATLRTNFPSLILRLATERRLPLVSHRKEWAEQGALLSYAADLAPVGRAAAPYIVKILNGAKPGDLPVERPTQFARRYRAEPGEPRARPGRFSESSWRWPPPGLSTRSRDPG